MLKKIIIKAIAFTLAVSIIYLLATGVAALILLLWGFTFSPVDVNVWGLGGLVFLVLLLINR